MREHVKTFIESEDGAITVDWVVLTGLIVGVQVLLLLTPLRNALTEVSANATKEFQSADFQAAAKEGAAAPAAEAPAAQ